MLGSIYSPPSWGSGYLTAQFSAASHLHTHGPAPLDAKEQKWEGGREATAIFRCQPWPKFEPLVTLVQRSGASVLTSLTFVVKLNFLSAHAITLVFWVLKFAVSKF